MTREVECEACEGHGIVTDEGGIYGVADCRFSKWIECVGCDGAGVIETDEEPAEIFEMSPRQFASVAAFGLVSLTTFTLIGTDLAIAMGAR